MAMPTKRSPKLEKEILDRLSAGEPLAKICREEGKPHVSTWADWCKQDEALGIAHTRARDDGFDAIAADILDIADDKNEDPQSRKVRIDARLKLLAKWDPKRYGELIKHGNADGSNIDLAAALNAGNARLSGEV